MAKSGVIPLIHCLVEATVSVNKGEERKPIVAKHMATKAVDADILKIPGWTKMNVHNRLVRVHSNNDFLGYLDVAVVHRHRANSGVRNHAGIDPTRLQQINYMKKDYL